MADGLYLLLRLGAGLSAYTLKLYWCLREKNMLHITPVNNREGRRRVGGKSVGHAKGVRVTIYLLPGQLFTRRVMANLTCSWHSYFVVFKGYGIGW